MSSHKHCMGPLRLSIFWQVGRVLVEMAAEIIPDPSVGPSKRPEVPLLVLLKQKVKASLLEPFPASEIHTVH